MLVLPLVATAAAATPNNGSAFVQPHFVISMFIEPQWSPQNYKLIKQANFTTVLHEHGCCLIDVNGTAVLNATARADSVRWCEEHGLDVIIKYNEAGWEEVGANSPAVLGLNIKDEPQPTPAEFTMLRKMTDTVRARLPGRLPFINMGGSIYDHPERVEQYVQAVRPAVLCFDRCKSSNGPPHHLTSVSLMSERCCCQQIRPSGTGCQRRRRR